MINLQNISLVRGERTLLQDVSLTFHHQQKIGLIGKNGSGKSSLLQMIMRQLEPSSGDITYSDNCRFAHVAQETPALSCSAYHYVRQGDTQLNAIMERLEDADEHGDYEVSAKCHTQLAHMNGYAKCAQIKELLSHLGFHEQAQQDAVAHFSGGWRMRLNLAQALITPADVLFLDEPTNHLDLPAILWLEKWLQQYKGTLILISHDREFLDKVVTHIAHIDCQSIKIYTGNYSMFEATRAQQIALQQSSYEKQQKQISHMMRFVDRFKAKASKAKQAQSRLKMIDKIERVAAVQAESGFQFDFFPADCKTNPYITLVKADLGYGDKTILKNVSLQILPGMRIGLLGKNGAGKSTFIKSLMGKAEPLSGELTIAKDLKIGYFSQHQVDYLDENATALEQLQSIAKNASTQELRNYLGQFQFSGDMALQKIRAFSGGERSRLALALLIWQRPSLLLLDEPTNHLDLEMRMALTIALQNYDGALLLVSHDRYLMNSIIDQLYLIHHHKLTPFDESLDEYTQFLLHEHREDQKIQKSLSNTSDQLDELDRSSVNSSKNIDHNNNYQKPSRSKDHSKTLAVIEKKIAALQEKLQTCDNTLCDTHPVNNRENYEKLVNSRKELVENIERLEEQWLDLHCE